MADQPAPPIALGAPLARVWLRISPPLVPVLAVLTALVITIPFMIVTGGRGDVGRGLSIAGTAYSALIEGATGLAINDRISGDDFGLINELSRIGDGLTPRELRGLANDVETLAVSGTADALRYADVLPLVEGMDEETVVSLGEKIPDINDFGAERLRELAPLIAEIGQFEVAEARALLEQYAAMDALTAEDRAALEATAPSAAEYEDDDLLAAMSEINEVGIVSAERSLEQLTVLEEMGIASDSPEAQTIADIAALQGGLSEAEDLAASAALIEESGITNLAALQEQLNLVRELYSRDVLTDENVAAAIDNELQAVSGEWLLVRRPGNRLVIDQSSSPAGVVYTAEGVPDVVYLRLPGSALLFFPANLESMIVRSIPFVIAGLAVALGFKAGLFNIGAEGQLYIGATLAVWVGFSPLFDAPMIVRLPFVLLIGVLGGALWGAIPGALKAYTGAHEVIVTIMLNFVAVRLVDWLIKSTNPLILLDPEASTPRTPYIGEASQLPGFNDIAPIYYILAGLVVFALLYLLRPRGMSGSRALPRAVIVGMVVLVGGLFLRWITVTGSLHFGLLLMLAAVWFTEWFLNKTTLGFELRTVGANPDAARYAGMNVRRNVIFALALSGALAGLAGVGEISGKVYSLQPEFFSGLGFDAIAVALLARSSPRNMIVSGLLWGSLLAGAGLMQVRADISIDLVKIIQALIIMFVAADAIIRYVWRVPKTPERSATTTFSKGWGS